MATASSPSLQEEVDGIRWWHSIDLGHGVVTPGGYDNQEQVRRAAMPADLSGWSVLDIGAWDGFYSFEAERRGASRVMALDHVIWNDPNVGRRGFDLARRALRSRVEDVDCDVHSITPERVGGTYDLALFLGVLYHIHHPILALERVASVCDRMLILETHVDLEEVDRPAMAFYPGTECAGDHSNWFGPNRAAVEAMLRTVGFRTVKTVWTHLDSKRQPVGYKVAGGAKGGFGRGSEGRLRPGDLPRVEVTRPAGRGRPRGPRCRR